MTESKAIELLEYIRERGNGEAPYVGCAQNIAIEMAINALKKQIATKPNKAIDKTWGIENEVNVCPICDYYLTSVHFISIDENEVKGTDKVAYCETCGQKIDYNE